MPIAPRHAQLVRFFQGEFGDQLFARTVLRGPTGRAKSEMLSYLALYADRNFPYVQLVPTGAPTSRQAARDALNMRFPDEMAQAESKGARAVVAGSPANVDETIWELGAQQVGRFGLPVIFMSWMRVLQNSQPRVELWYPSMTQGRWALARFQSGLRQRR